MGSLRPVDSVKRMLTPLIRRAMSSYSYEAAWASAMAPKPYPQFIPTTTFQKAILFAGSGTMGLYNPWRYDMVALNAEVFGLYSLKHMLNKMKESPEGRAILQDRPRISTRTVDYDWLSRLPENTLGNRVYRFNLRYKISPDTRNQVQYVQDPDLAYVLQRYREIHDMTHTLLEMPVDIVGEVIVKWVEALQYGMPMCQSGAMFFPLRYRQRSQFERYYRYRPWAIKVGTTSRFILNTYFEKRWEQDFEELRRELLIEPPPKKAKAGSKPAAL